MSINPGDNFMRGYAVGKRHGLELGRAAHWIRYEDKQPTADDASNAQTVLWAYDEQSYPQVGDYHKRHGKYWMPIPLILQEDSK
jgi:hypothetical protein